MDMKKVFRQSERTGRTNVNTQAAETASAVINLRSLVFDPFGGVCFEFSDGDHFNRFIGTDIGTISATDAFCPVIFMKSSIAVGNVFGFKGVSECLWFFKQLFYGFKWINITRFRHVESSVFIGLFPGGQYRD